MGRQSSFGFQNAVAKCAAALVLVSASLVAACGEGASSLPADEELGTPQSATTPEARTNEDGKAATPGASGNGGTGGAGNDGGVATPRSGPVSCTGKAGAAGDKTITLGDTKIVVHVPANVDPTKGAMLILNFHGLFSDGVQQQLVSGMNKEADTKGIIIAYPTSKDTSWNGGECCGDARKQNRDDVGMVRTLLAEIDKDFCVDKARVYATGFSNGGFLVNRLACEMSDTFAAVAVASGGLGMPEGSCSPKRAVPYFHSHGTGDELVPFKGGKPTIGGALLKGIVDAMAGTFRPVDETIAFWKQNAACTGEPVAAVEKADSKCVVWDKCGKGGAVELCTITDMGHNWPGGFPNPFGGKYSNTISISPMIIEFFEKHTL